MDSAYRIPAVDVARELNSSLINGLTSEHAKQLLKKVGPNVVGSSKSSSWVGILLNQLKSVIVILLCASATVSFIMQHWLEGIAIVVVLIINTMIGFFTEWQARTSMDALKKLGRTEATVLRDGQRMILDSVELVPGDVVLLEAGQIVPADARVFESVKLGLDESPLTGESLPVEKRIDPIFNKAPIHEHMNMVFKGTSVLNGVGRAIVTATGESTQVGQIVSLTTRAKEELTPLEKRLEALGQKLLWVTLIIGVVIFTLGWMSGKNLLLMFETAIALAVATIPEGLPIVATIALAKGMLRMARKNALINKLSAVEALGATSLILSDKTGTLTENVMTVEIIKTADRDFTRQQFAVGELAIAPHVFAQKSFNELSLLERIIATSSLCNDSQPPKVIGEKAAGDPLEVALLNNSLQAGTDLDILIKNYPRIREEPFDANLRMMATFHSQGENIFVLTKGAPEAILGHCKREYSQGEVRPMDEKSREYWLEQNNFMAQQGLRIIALACKTAEFANDNPYNDLIMLALVGLQDPPRQDIKEAIQKCQQAGVKVVMATGDQLNTAISIGKDVGLINSSGIYALTGDKLGDSAHWAKSSDSNIMQAQIFSRVSPRQKLELVSYFQDMGNIVAVTGDGINDAPALKKADIGIAMGLRGTQVARDVADMVLRDDSFSSIVAAIHQGRVIFANIRRFVVYLLSCNLSEVFIIGIASAINSPLPILPLQILFLNLVTDVFPALALGMSEGDEGFLKLPPRNANEPVITNSHWRVIFAYGLILTAATLATFYYVSNVLAFSIERAVTIAFLTLGFSQVFHVFNMSFTKAGFFANDVFRNQHVWMAVALCTVLLVSGVYLPFVNQFLKLSPLGYSDWGYIALGALSPLILIQGGRLIYWQFMGEA